MGALELRESTRLSDDDPWQVIHKYGTNQPIRKWTGFLLQSTLVLSAGKSAFGCSPQLLATWITTAVSLPLEDTQLLSLQNAVSNNVEKASEGGTLRN